MPETLFRLQPLEGSGATASESSVSTHRHSSENDSDGLPVSAASSEDKLGQHPTPNVEEFIFVNGESLTLRQRMLEGSPKRSIFVLGSNSTESVCFNIIVM